jgi:hypothetical protein
LPETRCRDSEFSNRKARRIQAKLSRPAHRRGVEREKALLCCAFRIALARSVRPPRFACQDTCISGPRIFSAAPARRSSSSSSIAGPLSCAPSPAFQFILLPGHETQAGSHHAFDSLDLRQSILECGPGVIGSCMRAQHSIASLAPHLQYTRSDKGGTTIGSATGEIPFHP